MNYQIIADSASDLTEIQAKEYEIDIVPYYVSFGLGEDKYYKENEELTRWAFYEELSKLNDPTPKTSMPTMLDYSTKFEKYLEQGKDVLCICLTSKFSGSYSMAKLAENELKEKYPDREIIVMDSTLASFAEGLLAIKAAQMRDEGLSISDNVKILERLKEEVSLFVTVDSLTFLKKGGRIGKASALAGSLLNIKPIISLKEGELLPFGKIRTRRKALEKLIDLVPANFAEEKEKYDFIILHGDAYEDAIKLEQRMKDEFGIELAHPPALLGATIGAHIGPTVVAIGCMKKRHYL